MSGWTWTLRGALLRGEAHDVLEAVDVVLREREDEAERHAGVAQHLEVLERALEGARRGPGCGRARWAGRRSTRRAGPRSGAMRPAVVDASMPLVVIVVRMPSVRGAQEERRQVPVQQRLAARDGERACSRGPAASSRHAQEERQRSSSCAPGPDDE